MNTTNPLTITLACALFLGICGALALAGRWLGKRATTPEALAETQLLDARRAVLQHQQAAEYHTALAEGHGRTVARLTAGTSKDTQP